MQEKKLIYVFNIDENINDMNDILKHPMYMLHIKCLKQYAKKFNKALIIITVTNHESKTEIIENVKILFNDIFTNIEIKIEENDKVDREAKYFHKYIIQELGNIKEQIFFAHTKGLSRWNTNLNCSIWVAAMYYFNLEYIDNVNYVAGFPFDYYKTNKTIYNINFYIKEPYMFSGTFYWLNPKNINKYIKESGKKFILDYMNNEKCPLRFRMLAENFPLYTIPMGVAETINKENILEKTKDKYILFEFYEHDGILKYIKEFYPEYVNKFIDFYNNLIAQLK